MTLIITLILTLTLNQVLWGPTRSYLASLVRSAFNVLRGQLFWNLLYVLFKFEKKTLAEFKETKFIKILNKVQNYKDKYHNAYY